MRDSVKVLEILYGIPEAYSLSLRLSQLTHHIYKRELSELPPLRLCEVKRIDVRVECYSHGPVLASPPVLASKWLFPFPQRKISLFLMPCML